MVEAFPLSWPVGWKRTNNRVRARFSQMKNGSLGRIRGTITFERAASELYNELKLLGGKNIVLSSNLVLRKDGIPYSDQKRPSDPGIAVYFMLNGKEQCIPCDKWDRAEDNIKAIAKTVEALRGLDRWGAKEMVDAAFRGFVALPAPISTAPDYFGECGNLDQINARYKVLAKELHPDLNSSPNATEEFSEMQRQFIIAKEKM